MAARNRWRMVRQYWDHSISIIDAHVAEDSMNDRWAEWCDISDHFL
jgi:hypothetical protein